MSGASNYAQTVDNTFIYIVTISVIILLGVTFAMIYFVIRYSRKRNPKPSNIEGNLALEVIWITVPTLLALSMFYYGFTAFSELRKVPKGAMTVKVTGQMWKWSFEYANGKKYDTLYVPVHTPVKLELSSLDVVHSFYIPSFRIKEDAVPGKKDYLVFTANNTGVYQVECAEYCGMNHAYMLNKVIVIPQEDFAGWLNENSNEPSSASNAHGGVPGAVPENVPQKDGTQNETGGSQQSGGQQQGNTQQQPGQQKSGSGIQGSQDMQQKGGGANEPK
ncbi:MAG TPA: cytochrome c oxidase subunit II [Ignavibacteriales bacterium]|nr:cytochrome c oxidase subunit II [Ignavibacteriales bacterium]